MILTRLELAGFRSYERLRLEFASGLNLLVGPNGVGKTNVVESIHYLSLARSFRTPNDDLLVKRGGNEAVIRADITAGGHKRRIAIAIGSGGKKILVNDKPITRLSELSSLVNVLVFEPRDVIIFDDLPKARRKFLDIALIKHKEGYLEAITRYERLLKERNEILKQEKVNLTQLDVVTKQLVTASEPIVGWRQAYLEQVNGVIDKIVKSIGGATRQAKVRYEPYVASGVSFTETALEQYARTQEGDIRRKVTGIGVHREDFHLDLDESDVASYGSQGENRLLAIALKLSPYFLIEDKERRPIIVLDDVLSELDMTIQDRLMTFLQKFEQVFVTTTNYTRQNGTIYDVGPHGIQRRTVNGI